MTSKFSVIIPLYNKEKDIKKTLKSVLSQTFIDFEIVIINDGSIDNSLAVVNSVNDDRIKVFSKTNEGVSKARNYGVEKAQTPFIAFLDADDYWYPNHLEDLDLLIQQIPEGEWFLTAYEKKYSNTLIVPLQSPLTLNEKGWKGIATNYFENSLVDCLAWTSAVAMKTIFFKSLNGFDTNITHGAGEDTDLWLRAALVSQPAFINKVSATHNLLGENRISHTPTLNRSYMNLDKYEKEASQDYFLKKYLDLNRYSFALQHKLAGDSLSFIKYYSKIDFKNLNKKQHFLLEQNKYILKLLMKFKNFFEKKGIRLSSFK
jgi:glycosyltransferase involved in cell wall biosynthesis